MGAYGKTEDTPFGVCIVCEEALARAQIPAYQVIKSSWYANEKNISLEEARERIMNGGVCGNCWANALKSTRGRRPKRV